MPICNIIDRRSNNYNSNIMAIFEDSWHDNGAKDGTHFEVDDQIIYLGIKSTNVENAIKYANQEFTSSVTLFLYDVGANNVSDYDTIELINNKYVGINI